ncbi:DUF3040 domain-containing protein [Streptomyces canus]|uniref:DUF3040 domain-containing protein n=1 Tax=Streptomyces canus TaxID=58343 RepID=A0AAW8F984_9ACTN|nr:DUF3040 domain-containing protein [Streptomyces canus]MDQ0764847.1 hypothetical protein [Streptomyces canus]MDQ0906696.1 hypothetical protein [Streptomyces canus]MDQ1066714.1 hypothetical protein [Streptomyces canus]
MTTGRLPDHEQRILDEVERALRRDRRLDRRLRTGRLRRRPDLSRVTHYRPRVLTVVLLLAVSIALLVTGIVTSRPAVIWTFAAIWPLTLFAVFRLVCRWTER